MLHQLRNNEKVQSLPRGGYVVDTSVGYIQFGSPPETIKDTMQLPGNVPKVFVLSSETFHVEKGIATAELEFPLYFNHFICQVKTLVICTKKQKKQLRTVFSESIFGPEEINLANEYPEGEKSDGFPDIRAEMNYFRGKRKLDDLVEFGLYKMDRYKFKDVIIYRDEGEGFRVIDQGEEVARIPWKIPYQIKYDIGERLETPFEAPEFGITCLGPSHGFDPEDNTSGFIIWINRRGIMIDPPVDSTEWLRRSNVNPKLIKHVILTHCHADHDAGTFQKILEEFVITIHTTETVIDSFMRKYTALTEIPKKVLYEFFRFNPVMVDRPVLIESAEFIFHYSLHSIPALGFSVRYRNKSFFYSSDHLNHPETLTKMNDSGVFTESRYDFLKEFNWNHDILYHEAGIPPLHTPVSYLASLPEEVQKKIYVYHIAEKDFPKDSHLTLVKFGIENTVYPEIMEFRNSESIQLLDVLNNVDLFRDFPLFKAREFLMIAEREDFAKGERIISKGTAGNKFYIIVSGIIQIEGIDSDFKKTYGKYEYFGETSIITKQLRTADVIAATDVVVLTIEGSFFLNFIHGTSLEKGLHNLSVMRESRSWDVLSESEIFGRMTSHQKTQLETILKRKDVKKGTFLFKKRRIVEEAYILEDGRVDLIKRSKVLRTMGKGDFIGDIFSIQKKQSSPFSAYVAEDSNVFAVNRSDLCDFIQRNPGVYIRLIRSYSDIV